MKSMIKKNQIMITALAIMIGVAGYLHFAGTKLEGENYLPTVKEAADRAVDSVSVENITEEGIESEYDLSGMLDLSEEDLETAAATEDILSMDADVDMIMEDYLEEGMETVLNETVEPGTETADAGEAPDAGEIPGEAVFTSATHVAALSEAKLMKEQTRAKNKEMLLEIINNAALSDTQKQDAVDNMLKLTGIAEQETAAEILLEAKGFADVVVSISDTGVDVVVNAEQLSEAQRAQIEDIVKRKSGVDAEDIIISTVVQ